MNDDNIRTQDMNDMNQTEETVDVEDTETTCEETMEDCIEETSENVADASDDTSQENADDTAKTAKESKKLFKGKEKADKKKDKNKEAIEALEDRVKRQMAEFENFRRRSEKEKSQMFEMGAKSVVEKILPVIDNFERGLQAVSDEEKATGFGEGMEMIYKQLLSELDSIGVKPIEAVGTEFNPDLHNAVMQVESDEYESNIVAQELQKGYMYRETVVRHSMVAVVS